MLGYHFALLSILQTIARMNEWYVDIVSVGALTLAIVLKMFYSFFLALQGFLIGYMQAVTRAARTQSGPVSYWQGHSLSHLRFVLDQ